MRRNPLLAPAFRSPGRMIPLSIPTHGMVSPSWFSSESIHSRFSGANIGVYDFLGRNRSPKRPTNLDIANVQAHPNMPTLMRLP